MNNKNNKRKRILLIPIFIILLLIAINNLKSKNKSIDKEYYYNYQFNVAGITINATDSVLSDEPNRPMLGAGMIPIKYKDGIWEITSVDDEDWYNYSDGKFATIMLSDGYYVSEEQYNMNGIELARKGMQVSDDNLGTIFVWVPRSIQIKNKDSVDYKFLVGNSIVDYEQYKTPSCFQYVKDISVQYSFTGIWVQKNSYNSQELVKSTINEMNTKENNYGLIKNELVEYLSDTAYTITNLVHKGKTSNQQQIDNIENKNRVMIRVINMNNLNPLTAKAQVVDNNVSIKAVYHENDIDKIIYIDTSANEIHNLTVVNNSAIVEGKDKSKYKFVVIDKIGNIVTVSFTTAIGIPDLTGFRVDTTFVVAYSDITGDPIEDSSIPIYYILSENSKIDKETNTLIEGNIDMKKVNDLLEDKQWFNYPESVWANVSVRNNGNEAYFVWIPRYVYQLNNEEQIANIKFVNTDNQDSTGDTVDMTKWTLPDAFIWQTDTETIQLTGFWTSKYELSGKTAFNFSANATGVVEAIEVNSISNGTGLGNSTYDFYVYKTGVDRSELLNKELMKEWQVTYLSDKTGVCTIDGIPGGIYDLRIILKSNGKYMGEIWKEGINVQANNIKVAEDSGLITGVNRIRVNNMTDLLDSNIYKLYLYEAEDLEKGEVEPDPDYRLDDGTYYCDNRNYVRFAIVDKSGITDSNERKKNQVTFNNLKPTTYSLRIVAYDSNGIRKGETWYDDLYVVNKGNDDNVIGGNINNIIDIDLTGFRTDTTFLVLYKEDEEGKLVVANEDIPIYNVLDNGKLSKTKLDSVLQDGEVWYDYDNSIWANIVTRNNGSAAYFVYTPRYVYKLDNIREETEIRFVEKDKDLTSLEADGWILPDAFTWITGTDEDENPIKMQLPGFWTSKYELSGKTNFSFSASVTGLVEEIKIDNISNGTGLENSTYDFYVYKTGVDKTKLLDNNIINNWQVAYTGNESGNYLFKAVPGGTYDVRLVLKSNGHYMGEIWKDGISVQVNNLGVPEDSGLIVGVNNIRINNITDDLDFDLYKIYLYESNNLPNTNIKNNNYDEGQYVRYAEVDKSSITDTNARKKNQTTFTVLRQTTYSLRIIAFDENNNYRSEKWYNDLYVVNKSNDNNVIGGNINDIIEIDLTGFRTDTTYLVTYINNGGTITQSRENIPISSVLENGKVSKNKLQSVLQSGEIWYDYDNSIWANVVTKNNNKVAYFVYTPRYVYKLDNVREETEIRFVEKDKDLTSLEAEEWILPEAFTWIIGTDENGNPIKLQLSGFWTSKYELSS